MPKKPTTPEPRSPIEIRQALAQAGDVDGLLRILAETPAGLIDPDAVFPLVLEALQVRSEGDPRAFSEFFFSRMLTFTAYLLIRAQSYVSAAVSTRERSLFGADLRYFSREVHEVLLPRLLDLQGHLAELAQAQATTARVWQLERQKRLENDRNEKAAKKRGCEKNGHVPHNRFPGRALSHNGKTNVHAETAPTLSGFAEFPDFGVTHASDT